MACGKPLNIYALTRIEDVNHIKRAERQMSGRPYFLNVKKWEIDCLKIVAEKLAKAFNAIDMLDFYYSFQIPKLGKEFDLLKITDEYVINIELKSLDVEEEKIRKQLIRNRYYLSSLSKTIKSYTYLSSQNKLYRLTKSENLVETDFDKLVEDIKKAGPAYTDDIENLFKEENYIISPLANLERFLRRDYFLTSQQNDIKNRILKNVKENTLSFQGFTGLPGTGKTLLLYDIAMEMSYRQRVCVLHFGSFPKEMSRLNARLKRVDFYNCKNDIENNFLEQDYQAVFVDEGHRITKAYLEKIREYSIKRRIPVIISYDSEEAVSIKERIKEKENDPVLMLENISGFVKYRLTNRIRMNSELSSFINCLLRPSKYRRKNSYPDISVNAAKDKNEADYLLNNYIQKGYKYIDNHYETTDEYNSVVMIIDKDFYYDNDGFLRNDESIDITESIEKSKVSFLFHGLNRAKQKLAIIIVDNDEVLDEALYILQGPKA